MIWLMIYVISVVVAALFLCLPEHSGMTDGEKAVLIITPVLNTLFCVVKLFGTLLELGLSKWD